MPFGLTGAPSSFQRLINKLFRDLPFVTAYMDDLLIYSANVELHVKHLQEVFCRLRKAGLTLRGHKCCIGNHKVKYLGDVFSAKGTLPNENKIGCEELGHSE